MLQSYLEELRKTPLLEPEEERQLWQQAAEGDLAAHQKLMTSYQPLVFKIAASFKLGEAETMELIQEGMVGLLEAAESYDYTRQVAFSLFASFRIKGNMVDYLRHADRKGLLYLDSEISQGFTLSDTPLIVPPKFQTTRPDNAERQAASTGWQKTSNLSDNGNIVMQSRGKVFQKFIYLSTNQYIIFYNQSKSFPKPKLCK